MRTHRPKCDVRIIGLHQGHQSAAEEKISPSGRGDDVQRLLSDLNLSARETVEAVEDDDSPPNLWNLDFAKAIAKRTHVPSVMVGKAQTPSHVFMKLSR